MKARYSSDCPGCGGRISAGDTIKRSGGRYVCADCYTAEVECEGHPAGPFDPMGETTYCDGSCREARADAAEYARGYNETRVAQTAGPPGSAAREAAYMEMEARWAREGFDG